MSVPSVINKMSPYACNGATVNFAFTFPIFAQADLQVWLTDSDGVETKLILTTHYYITATNNDYANGGTVTTEATYAEGNTITLIRVLALTQGIDYQPNDDFPANTHERGLDRLTMIAQQLEETIDRNLTVPITDEVTSLEIPNKATRTSKFLAFNAEGVPIAAETLVDVPVTDYMKTVLDDEDAAAARTTLGIIAANIPIVDAGTRFTAAEVEAVLQEIVGAGRTTETVKDNADAILENLSLNILTKDADYTISDTDKNPVILVTTGAADKTITWPTAADNVKNVITVMKTDDGAGKVINDGEGAETIDGFATIENLQQGDFIKAVSDGTKWLRLNPLSWHKFSDPPTGRKATKATWATADDFGQGLEVTFSEVPAGAKAVRSLVEQATTPSWVYWRKSGDTNIANSPADSEYSHALMKAEDGVVLAVLWLSSDYKVQFTITNTSTDLYVGYPTEYLI